MWLRLRELDKQTRKAYTPSTFKAKWGVSIDDGPIQILAELRELLTVVKKLQRFPFMLCSSANKQHNQPQWFKPKVLEQIATREITEEP